MEEIIALILSRLAEAIIQWGIEQITVAVHDTLDDLGHKVTDIVVNIDTDGDGVFDTTQTIYTLTNQIPSFDDGYTFVNSDDTIGIGLPQIKLLDNSAVSSLIDINNTVITGNSDGYLIDYQQDGSADDVIIPLPDFSGDGVSDWGLLVDDNKDGLPDASPDAPFFEIGSDGYYSIVNNYSSDNAPEPSIILVGSDGEMMVYNRNGDLTEQDCDTAYSLWVADNNIMSKPLADYTVTEGILFLGFVVAGVSLISKIFRKRRLL